MDEAPKVANCIICHGPLDIKKNEEGKVIWDQGENAMPVQLGRCCLGCNFAVVIPARLRQAMGT